MTAALPPDLARALADRATRTHLLVCCDFDGTLSPIVPVPSEARPLAGAVEALTALGDCSGTRVALLSGRALSDLRVLTGVPDSIALVGSHGAEFSTHDVLGDPERQALAALDEALTSVTAGIPGVELERKPMSIAVHVRRADRTDAARVVAAVKQGPARRPGIHVTTGKEVVELSVIPVDKGVAVERLRTEAAGSSVLYLGDDVTDERAFAVLRAGDLGVKVGGGPTAAEFRVADPPAALAVLEYVLDLRRRNG